MVHYLHEFIQHFIVEQQVTVIIAAKPPHGSINMILANHIIIRKDLLERSPKNQLENGVHCKHGSHWEYCLRDQIINRAHPINKMENTILSLYNDFDD